MAFVPFAPVATSSFLGSRNRLSCRKNTLRTRPVHRRSVVLPRCSATTTSTSTHVERKASLLEALKEVQDPDLGKDIVTLGFVKDIQFIETIGSTDVFDSKFTVELTTPACPVKEQFRADCQRIAESLPFIRNAEVVMTAQAPNTSVSTAGTELEKIGAVLAVASCKGGVGKSTTAVNLAFSLSESGARVGLFDADIYGPSLPTLVVPEHDRLEFQGNLIKPLTCKGVKLMSFGYVNPNPAVMRGPMIAGMMKQLLTTTSWGELDYLIIDLPPGTGDIQLTLCQTLEITAAVIVTTPQKLALVDVLKGIDMFQRVKVSPVAVVENMAYFKAPDTDTKHYLFGTGHGQQLKEQFNSIGSVVQIPIEPRLSEDVGVPYVLESAESETAKRYGQLADEVVREIAKIQHGGHKVPDVSFDTVTGDIVIRREETGEEQRIWPAVLRRLCACALCIDELTGKPLLDPTTVSESIKPLRIAQVGNYAFEVDWSDGHPSLYPFARIVKEWPSDKKKREEEEAAKDAVAQ